MPDGTIDDPVLAELRTDLTESSAGHRASALRHLDLAAAAGVGADGYADDRALAFVHQWCFLIEQPPADPAPLQQLIGDPVRLRLSDGRELTGFEEISTWHDATAHAMEVTSHSVLGWARSQPTVGHYDLAIDFAWQGISPAGQAMTARTHHEWVLHEDGTRFPRLSSFVSHVVEPFAPVAASDALADLRSSRAAAAAR